MANLDENKPSPSSSSNQQPISPYQVQQNSVPASNTSDFDSNSQLSPPPLPASTQDSVLPIKKEETSSSGADLKRAQSIQEMREKERRRREEMAGKSKIDMNEQHKLMAQFEQNLIPPSN